MRRYEARVDGDLMGYAEYQVMDDLIIFPHTVTDPEFEGRGIASALVRGALDDVRVNRPGLAVVPECDFVKGWIERHPDYADLLVGRRPPRDKDE
ncbi:MAG: N-acetyltransferase [Actinomycetia bacterium]|nr:N-acetyltransferase [Actinomycetes bacterium]